MSAFKGTPGPWEVCNGSDVFTLLGARNASGAVAAENDGWHIADCDMGPSSTGEGEADIPHAEKRANARLIAASPRMYDYIAVKARAGDKEAQEIISGVDHAQG